MMTVLSPGTKLTCPIQSVHSFGFFVDLDGGLEGFVHTTQISRNSSRQTTDDLGVGQMVTAWVLDSNLSTGRVALTMINPNAPSLATLRPGQRLSGTVVALDDSLGAFVDVGAARDGLLHISEFVRAGIRKASDKLREGDEVTVWIKSVDLRQERLSLSMRPPPSRSLRDIRPGEVLKGTVVRIEDSLGAFVDIDADQDGLVHLSELSWKRSAKPQTLLKVGQEVEVYVLNVDLPQKRISLSLKRLQPEPWSNVENRYYVGQLVEGIITNMTEFGAFALVNDEIEGLIHISEMSNLQISHPNEVVREGEKHVMRIIRIEASRQRMSLSLARVADPAYADLDWQAELAEAENRRK